MYTVNRRSQRERRNFYVIEADCNLRDYTLLSIFFSLNYYFCWGFSHFSWISSRQVNGASYEFRGGTIQSNATSCSVKYCRRLLRIHSSSSMSYNFVVFIFPPISLSPSLTLRTWSGVWNKSGRVQKQSVRSCICIGGTAMNVRSSH